MGARKIVGRGGDEEDLCTLPVNRNLHLDAGNLFDLIDRKIHC
jgi:hypothetical protein